MKRSLMLALTALTALTALAALPALAHDGMHGPAAAFDKDGDGSLSLAEYRTYLEKQGGTQDAQAQFAKLDANADGKLSSAELLRPPFSPQATSGEIHQELTKPRKIPGNPYEMPPLASGAVR